MRRDESQPPRVFVSFATADGFYRQVIARLTKQPVAIWDYERPRDEVRGGRSITEACRTRIDSSDMFVVLVSNAALQSPWVRAEVERAHERRETRGLNILPVVDRQVEPLAVTSSALRSLGDIKACHVDIASLASIEHAIAEICRLLEVDHEPPIIEDDRLPVMKRLYEEVRRKTPSTPYGSELYQRLLRILYEFHEAFERREYERATCLVKYLNQTLEHEYREAPFYYPYIVEAVSLMMLGQQDDALATLERLQRGLQGAGLGQGPDENLAAAFGCVYFQMGRFAEAEAYYESALELAPNDASNHAALLMARLRTGQRVDLPSVFSAMDRCSRLGQDAKRIALTKAVGKMSQGLIAEALEDLQRLAADAECDAETFLHGAALLQQLGRLEAAKRMLDDGVDRHGAEGRLRCASGDLALRMNDAGEAARHFEYIAAHFPADWQLQFESIRGLWQAGACPRAREVARSLLERERPGLPRRPHEFFVSGAANWVLGRTERAEYDFQRSRKNPNTWHYELFLR